jgi:hypothetical protein
MVQISTTSWQSLEVYRLSKYHQESKIDEIGEKKSSES